MEDHLLNTKEVEEILHVSRTLLYTLLKRGDIPTVRIGRMIRIRRADLERYINERSFKNHKDFKVEDPKLKG